MSNVDFGDPIAVTELPPAAARGGRQSNEPALIAWLDKVPATGVYQLASTDKDGGHPVSRVTQLRKLAEPRGVMIQTRVIETGKRYFVYGTREVANQAATAPNTPEPVKNARKR